MGEDNIKIDLKEMGTEVLDWIHLGQDRDQWRAFAKLVMKTRISVVVEELLASQEGLNSIHSDCLHQGRVAVVLVSLVLRPNVKFVVVAVLTTKSTAFWEVILCGLADIYQRSGVT
jgi:hypothetical protein